MSLNKKQLAELAKQGCCCLNIPGDQWDCPVHSTKESRERVVAVRRERQEQEKNKLQKVRMKLRVIDNLCTSPHWTTERKYRIQELVAEIENLLPPVAK